MRPPGNRACAPRSHAGDGHAGSSRPVALLDVGPCLPSKPRASLIQKLYQEDRVKAAAAAAADSKNNQQGRRPGLDRKRPQFSLKPPQSNPVNVDFSQLDSIDDPEEYFLTLERLEKADMEIKKLRGETPTKKANYDRPIEPPKKRPGMRTYNFRLKHPFPRWEL
ncbi:uncharacterized protein LOC123446264 isoform X2 [Hordeum vulgare subsp. vulgare]|uniref:Uncharacterized protein n=1 Tax=Hordeum vulgare subsp. vulgare TaxID=112509 RepID=A0A8I6XYZ4_HORVV|nr:uncharacterized protein LOC123446264 isoform X2 [Hordeum vulgare subsp. vulgare]KAI4996952.1 hypothetical protein ZWY2020_052294 [Hordeum vulgare]